MKLTLFSYDFPPLSGGIARLTADIARLAEADGALAQVLTQGSGDVDGVPASKVRRFAASRPQRELGAARHLVRARPALVLCGNWYPEGVLCLLARVPYAVLAHGAEVCPPQSSIAPPWRAIAQQTLQRAEWVIANSQYTAGLVKSLASHSRVRALPLPVDTRKFTPGSVHEARLALGLPEHARIITTVARVEPFKGHDTVLRALGALREAEREDIRYLIVGTGPHLGELEKLTRSLGLGRQVELRGHVSETELRHVYHAADAYVMCTRDESAERRVEGYGLAFLEAQASGTPVIAARTGGIPDAVAPLGHNRLVDPLDTAALGRELATLARKTPTMSEALRAWVVEERHEAKYWRELRGLLAPSPLGADCASLHFEKV